MQSLYTKCLFLFPSLSGREAKQIAPSIGQRKTGLYGPLKSGQHQCFLPSLPRLHFPHCQFFFLMHAQLTSSQLQASTWSFGGSHRSSVEIINPSLTVNVSLVKRLTLTACSNHQHVFSCIHFIPWLWLLYTHTVLALTQKKMCILI